MHEKCTFVFSQKPGAPLPFEQCENFRELGGYIGMDGKRVRHGLFYRAPALSSLETPHDLALFSSLGVRAVIDFRSEPERLAQPDPTFPGIAHYNASAMVDATGQDIRFDLEQILSGGQRAIDEMLETVRQSYADMPFRNSAYRLLFRLVAEGATPLLFHCTAGKDRTGVAAALLLRALGVSREDILRDYEITNCYRAKARERFARTFDVEKIPLAEETAYTIFGVQVANLACSLDAIDARYPDFDTYLETECGFGAKALEQMRRYALEEPSAQR